MIFNIERICRSLIVYVPRQIEGTGVGFIVRIARNLNVKRSQLHYLLIGQLKGKIEVNVAAKVSFVMVARVRNFNFTRLDCFGCFSFYVQVGKNKLFDLIVFRRQYNVFRDRRIEIPFRIAVVPTVEHVLIFRRFVFRRSFRLSNHLPTANNYRVLHCAVNEGNVVGIVCRERTVCRQSDITRHRRIEIIQLAVQVPVIYVDGIFVACLRLAVRFRVCKRIARYNVEFCTVSTRCKLPFKCNGKHTAPCSCKIILSRFRRLIVHIVESNIFAYYVGRIIIRHRRECRACFNYYRIHSRTVVTCINSKTNRVCFAPNVSLRIVLVDFSQRLIFRFRGVNVYVI